MECGLTVVSCCFIFTLVIMQIATRPSHLRKCVTTNECDVTPASKIHKQQLKNLNMYRIDSLEALTPLWP